MNWVTIIWSGGAGACLVIAFMHLEGWGGSAFQRANLWFSLTVLGVVAMIFCELVSMYAELPETFENAIQWAHVASLSITIGMLGFVHSSFGTGRPWLLFMALGLRVAAVIANFTTGSSLHFLKVDSLEKISFLGAQVSVPAQWDPNPWLFLGPVAALTLLCYVADASFRLWRGRSPDQRRRAFLCGGSLCFFLLAAPAWAALSAYGVLELPINASVPFFAVILVMSYELRRAAAGYPRAMAALQNSEQRLRHAAAAARLGLWELDIATGQIWISDEGRALYNVSPGEQMNMALFFKTLHPDDRPTVEARMEEAVSGGIAIEAEYRLVLPDGSIRWISALGRVEQNDTGKSVLMRGVSMDITNRVLAAEQSEIQRRQVAHLSRINVLGTLAGTLAHELNQPLAAILANAQTGTKILHSEEPDIEETSAILQDVADDAKRAGAVIQGMRGMLKKEDQAEVQFFSPNEVVREVVAMLHSELLSRKIPVKLELEEILPPVCMDRVGFQQVLINLAMNGLDAMQQQGAGGTLKIITSRRGGVSVVSVHDSGPGIAADRLDGIFSPFQSTKPGGLGLGLSISRSIMESSGGELLAQNHPAGGAVFVVMLPVSSSNSGLPY